MTDLRMRQLEREALYDDDALAQLNRARRRIGLEAFRRNIVHYLKTGYHHRLSPNGEIDPRVEQSPVHSACGATELWPRRNYERKRLCHYTPDKDKVTCKTCLRCLSSPNFHEGKPALHMSLKTVDGLRRICGARHGISTEIFEEVGCFGCLRMLRGEPRAPGHVLNARGRRRLRRQGMFARMSDSQSDPFRHGV
jgi:hypothetical protein